MYLIYDFLLILIIPIIIIRLLLKSKKNKEYRKNILQRFGIINNKNIKPNCIWIHSVSVGESIIAVEIIKKLIKNNSDVNIVVTTMTPTGANVIKKAFKALENKINHLYIPYDISFCINLFIKKIKPKICVIIETELWPNFLKSCKKNNVTTILANARLSDKSKKGYKKISKITKVMLNNLDYVLAQTKEDAGRFKYLGFNNKKISIIGNAKYDLDITVPNYNVKLPDLKNKKIFIAASTHKGEEEKILEAFYLIRQKINNSFLILVPRHPERASEIKKILINFKYKKDLLLVDKLGVLLYFYSISDIAFVGGSFVDIGGHNMLEPAALKLPIITGPYLRNFSEISKKLLKNLALIIVNNHKELAEEVINLFSNDLKCEKMGKNAYDVVNANKGGINKIVQLVEEKYK